MKSFQHQTGGKVTRLFFLHIPKNAGSFVNKYAAMNVSNCRTHIEAARESQYLGVTSADVDYISGHIRLAEAKAFLDLDGYVKAVLLRSPVDHLVSHVNWVMRIAEDVSSRLFLSKPKHLQELSLFLQGIDFKRIDETRRFVRDLSDYGHQLFNNCQTRYLSASMEKLKYGKLDAISVLDDIDFFDIVGFVENIDVFVGRLAMAMGWKVSESALRVNAMNNRYGIPVSGMFRDVVAPLIEQDEVVYERALRRFSNML